MDSTEVIIRETTTPDSAIAMTIEQGRILKEWLLLMGDDTSRWGVEGAVGAVFLFFAFFVNDWIKRHLREEARMFLAIMAVGIGIILAWAITLVIPGFVYKELAACMGAGGAGTLALHKGRNKWESRRTPKDPPVEPGE